MAFIEHGLVFEQVGEHQSCFQLYWVGKTHQSLLFILGWIDIEIFLLLRCEQGFKTVLPVKSKNIGLVECINNKETTTCFYY